VRFTLSPQAGESQGDLGALDAGLGSWIAIEQTRGDAELATGAQALDGWQWLPVAVWALVVALVYLGIRPRLREYRACSRSSPTAWRPPADPRGHPHAQAPDMFVVQPTLRYAASTRRWPRSFRPAPEPCRVIAYPNERRAFGSAKPIDPPMPE
jgi:hypothetical protein